MLIINYFCATVSETSPISAALRLQLASRVITNNKKACPDLKVIAPVNMLIRLSGDQKNAKKALKEIEKLAPKLF